MAVRSIDVLQSSNLLAHFHQAQWHSLCIRINEDYWKKEKKSKSNHSPGVFKIAKYYLPQLPQTFLKI